MRESSIVREIIEQTRVQTRIQTLAQSIATFLEARFGYDAIDEEIRTSNICDSR